jgi:hypothetical protein
MSRDRKKESYTIASPAYHAGGSKGWLLRYTQDDWPIDDLVGEELAVDQRNYSAAPVNGRYQKKVSQLVSWREVLEANEYMIVKRNRVVISQDEPSRIAGVRHDGIHGEIFYINCVLHDERSSSLCLNLLGFHCYGCAAGGSIVDFVAGINHLRSAQAIKQYFAETFPQMQPRTK